ncbi:Jouberin [Orchesella cincta]|uniref:Jouberin n=1 Tax=Orchesella cincta TaxID=48709 RepID=A0A1D2NHJ4_ORCCI|nr:Jouberin [Orchesella cincta]
MSLQSLVEMDDLSKPERGPAQPKPVPRKRVETLGKPSKERDVDDVLSISSGSVKGESNEFMRPFSKNKNSSSAFDNPSFLTDDGLPSASEVSEKDDNRNNNRQPQPIRRKRISNPPNDGSNSPSSRQQRPRKLSWGSTQDESDQSTKVDNAIKSFRNDQDEDGGSGSTYTVENERYQETRKLTKKPPKPKPKSKLKTTFSTDKKLSSSYATSTSGQDASEDEQDTIRDAKTDKPSSPAISITRKKHEDHLSVEIEATDDGKNVRDEAETVSVSSDTTKETIKSRFGRKLFNTSGDKHKPLDTDNLSTKGKSGFVNRWKQTAHAFLKPSQRLVEEAEPTDEKDEKTVSPKEKVKAAESKDTRISMPEEASDSENENASVKSLVSVENETKPLPKKVLIRDDSIKSDMGKESKTETEEEAQSKKSKFKPLSIIKRNKSKEKLEKINPKAEKTEEPKIETLMKDSIPKEKVGKGKTGKAEKEIQQIYAKTREDKGKNIKQTHDAVEDSSSSSEEKVSESDEETKSERAQRKSAAPRTRKPQPKPRESLQLTDSSGRDLLFGITIHSSDLLPLDPNVIHPVVKVTVMLQSGRYIKRSEIVSNSKSESQTRSDKKSKKRKKDADEFSTSNAKDSVLPIMSQPCHARHSIPTFAPTWNELLVFEEPFSKFAAVNEPRDSEQEPVLFFEIMDFLPMNTNGSSSVSGFHGSDAGWYKVAWAFLKPIGANDVVNLNKKLRLQLFKPVKLRAKERLIGPEVYSWWKSGKREKVSSTLYITPKGIIPPETTTASLRQLLSMRKEHLTQAILDSQLATRKKKQDSKRLSMFELRDQANWSRMEGQICKPPNKLVASLPSSQIESLNIVISGNVHCLKFSPCGTKLAAGLDTDELHVVLLFEIPSGTLQKSLKGHHGIIYDMAWKIFELDDHTSYQYLASASADSTVRIWKMQNNDEKTLVLVQVLYHPSYVYSVKFHPTHPCLLATGCFDCVIRIWDMKPKHDVEPTERKRKSNKENRNQAASPIILLDKHSSFVNCMLFDQGGQTLFSGDGSSCLFRWSCRSPSQKKTWRLEKDAKLHHGDVPINSLDLHPSGNRILVHLRDNFIKILDIVTFIPLQTFPGLKNEKFQIRSCFSPCGNLVLSGSEDNTLCIWDADTGKILQFTTPRKHPLCIVSCVDYHPFDYYTAVGLASTISEPSPVLLYHHEQPKLMNYPLLKKTAQKFRQSLEKSRSQSTESVEDGSMKPRESRSSQLSAKRGDSSEKFISIIQKLDTALYLAQQRNKKRQSEAQSSTCVTRSEGEIPAKVPQEDKEKQPNEATEVVDGPAAKVHYVRKRRPRSASIVSKEKRELYKKSIHRAIQSDSEQTSKLKATAAPSMDNSEESSNVFIVPPKGGKRPILSHSASQSDESLNEDTVRHNIKVTESQEETTIRPQPKRRSKPADSIQLVASR